MISKNIALVNKLGLHARAAMKLVNLASRYQSDIKITYNNRQIEAKSIMNMMVLGASCGSQLKFELDGDDETQAWQAIEKLINNRFDEAE